MPDIGQLGHYCDYCNYCDYYHIRNCHFLHTAKVFVAIVQIILPTILLLGLILLADGKYL